MLILGLEKEWGISPWEKKINPPLRKKISFLKVYKLGSSAFCGKTDSVMKKVTSLTKIKFIVKIFVIKTNDQSIFELLFEIF